MSIEPEKYFRFLNLVMEDIREEIDLFGKLERGMRICDFGCGNGITTFGLALVLEASESIGIDLFAGEVKTNPKQLHQMIKSVRSSCESNELELPKNDLSHELCKLVQGKMLPQFRRGNIVLGKNLPRNIDFAYCRKVLTNIKGKEYENTPSGKGALLVGISNIVNCIRPHGWICIVEYDKEFKLGQYLKRGGIRLIKQTQIKRREIRSRGRTPVISDLAVYQCQKHV